MIVTISGTPGAGKSTVTKEVAKKLGLTHYYMGGMIRDMAKNQGLTLNEFYAKDKNVDKLIDDRLVKLGQEEDNFIVEGRTAFHFIPHSIKIYLDVNLKEGAERIFKDEKERNEKKYNDVDEVLESIKERLKTEAERYGRLYNLNVHDKSKYDFVLDTTNLKVEEVQQKLIKFIRQYKKR